MLCANMCACVHGCTRMWRPKVDIRCLPQSFPILFFEAESVTECGDHQLGYTGRATLSNNLPVSASARARINTSSGFIHGCWGLNLGLQGTQQALRPYCASISPFGVGMSTLCHYVLETCNLLCDVIGMFS